MDDIEIKSIGFILDELCTTSNRCWHAQEDIMNLNLSVEKRLDAAIRAQESNNKRNQLIRAIDKRLGEGNLSPDSKTYHTYFEEKE